jgi:hypothetical protein
MVTNKPRSSGATATIDRQLPPITEVAVASLILIVTGGIYLASYLPHTAPLGPAIGLLTASGVLSLANIVALSRVRSFAWDQFFLVGRWAFLAYIIIAGILEFVFVLDHTHGSMLLVLTCMLAVFAVNVPLLLAFSVARYQQA